MSGSSGHCEKPDESHILNRLFTGCSQFQTTGRCHQQCMDEQGAFAQNDALLLPWLHSADEAESERLLAHLVAEHAEPVIRQIIRSRLRYHTDYRGSASERQDADDACSEAFVRLLERLKECRSHPAEKAIGNFRGFVAVTAYHVCHQYLRGKYPQRQILKDKLRYLLTHQPGLGLWPGESGKLHCGFAAWRGQKEDWPRENRLRQLPDELQTVMQTALGRADFHRLNPAELVAAIFNQAGHPLEFDELVSVVAALRAVREQVAQSAADEERDDPFANIADHRVNVAAEAEQRHFLKWLWTEIGHLPVRQRMALLLNLRDEQGGGVVALLPVTGVASIRQIAAMLEMPLEELARLWPELPLEDSAIARRLSLTRQQVINLRKCARERLGRRIRDAGVRK
jgi:RNA polymerase sigma factor (sigma-70 family)